MFLGICTLNSTKRVLKIQLFNVYVSDILSSAPFFVSEVHCKWCQAMVCFCVTLTSFIWVPGFFPLKIFACRIYSRFLLRASKQTLKKVS